MCRVLDPNGARHAHGTRRHLHASRRRGSAVHRRMLLAKIGGWLRIPELRPSSTDWQKIQYSRCICAPALSGNASKTNSKRGISLGEVAARATHIEVACSGCDRRGGLSAREVGRSARRRLSDDSSRLEVSKLPATECLHDRTMRRVLSWFHEDHARQRANREGTSRG